MSRKQISVTVISEVQGSVGLVVITRVEVSKSNVNIGGNESFGVVNLGLSVHEKFSSWNSVISHDIECPVSKSNFDVFDGGNHIDSVEEPRIHWGLLDIMDRISREDQLTIGTSIGKPGSFEGSTLSEDYCWITNCLE